MSHGKRLMLSGGRPKHWISIAAMTAVITVAACTAEKSIKLQPALSLDGRTITGGTAAYDQGKQYFREGRLADAAEAFQMALFANGPSVQVLNALAVSYDELGRHDLSDGYFERALLLDPGSAQTLNNLAVSLVRRKAPATATKLFADAHAFDPGNMVIAANLERVQAEVRVAAIAATPASAVASTAAATRANMARAQRIGAPVPRLAMSRSNATTLSLRLRPDTASMIIRKELPPLAATNRPVVAANSRVITIAAAESAPAEGYGLRAAQPKLLTTLETRWSPTLAATSVPGHLDSRVEFKGRRIRPSDVATSANPAHETAAMAAISRPQREIADAIGAPYGAAARLLTALLPIVGPGVIAAPFLLTSSLGRNSPDFRRRLGTRG